jgi:hypothetical protein
MCTSRPEKLELGVPARKIHLIIFFFGNRYEGRFMSENSIPIRFEDLEDIQLQLLFEEHMFDGFEKQAIKYCQWLLKMNKEKRIAHHNSLARIAHVVRTAYGRMIDITPDCGCLMCAQWHSAAVQELLEQARFEKARRDLKKKAPRPRKTTFIYLEHFSLSYIP